MSPYHSSNRALTLLAIILVGCVNGVLWPINGFLLEFLAAFIAMLFVIVVIASLVWCTATLYVSVCDLCFALFKSQNKQTLMLPRTSRDDATLIGARIARAKVAEAKWIGVASLTGLAALWLFSMERAISTASNQLIVFSGWGAISCAGAALGLKMIAGAYNNDDVGTLGFLAIIAGALFTTLVLLGLFALM